MKQGFTLIELMISVAILGITAALGGNLIVRLSRESAELVLRERATQILEYEADMLMRRTPPDATTRRALLAELPESELTIQRAAGPVTTAEVRWKGAGGHTEHLSLAIVARVP